MTYPTSKNWCFTINNYTEEDEAWVFAQGVSPDVRYVLAGKEVGEALTPHLQGMLLLTKNARLTGMKKLHDQAHWEIMRGLPTQSAVYCKKDNDFYEAGDLPDRQQKTSLQMKQTNEERWALAREGRFDELPPEHIKTYQYIYSQAQVVEDRDDLDNLWIVGPSGAGKSRYVRDNHPDHYNKNTSKWWDGYVNEEVVLIDDWDPSHEKFLSRYIKIWADHYAFNAEVKGGNLKIRPKSIIVTSQYTIDQCFEEHETRTAVARRFTVLDMSKPTVPSMFAPGFVPGPTR